MNKVKLIGTVQNLTFSHQFEGEQFYKGHLKVKRYKTDKDTDSSNISLVEFMVSEHAIGISALKEGSLVVAKGGLRGYSKAVCQTPVSKVFFYIRELQELESLDDLKENEQLNTVSLEGTIVKQIHCGKPNFGNFICKAVVKSFRNPTHTASDLITICTWGKHASILKDLKAGTVLSINGRVDVRPFLAKTEKCPEGIQCYANEVNVSNFKVIS